jgi:HJR/Mrr/RecB family endonuclease
MNIKIDHGIFLQLVDKVLNFFYQQILDELTGYYSIDARIENIIELNRFDTTNIIMMKLNRIEEDLREKTMNEKVNLCTNLILDSLISTDLSYDHYPRKIEPYKHFLDDDNEFDDYDFGDAISSDLFDLNEDVFGEKDDSESLQENKKLVDWFFSSKKYPIHLKKIKEIILNELASTEGNSKIFKISYVDEALYKVLIKNPALVKTLDWRIFEELLADILSKLGYEIELQRGTKDGGVDLFALKKHHPFGVNRYLIQAKRWNNIVGVEPIERLIWAQGFYKATKACLVTTSTFTKGAWELANCYKWQIELKDFLAFMEWLKLADKSKNNFT